LTPQPLSEKHLYLTTPSSLVRTDTPEFLKNLNFLQQSLDVCTWRTPVRIGQKKLSWLRTYFMDNPLRGV